MDHLSNVIGRMELDIYTVGDIHADEYDQAKVEMALAMSICPIRYQHHTSTPRRSPSKLHRRNGPPSGLFCAVRAPARAANVCGTVIFIVSLHAGAVYTTNPLSLDLILDPPRAALGSRSGQALSAVHRTTLSSATIINGTLHLTPNREIRGSINGARPLRSVLPLLTACAGSTRPAATGP